MPCYLRINTQGDTPMEFINLTDEAQKDGAWKAIREQIGASGIGVSTFSIWCNDGKRYKVKCLYNDNAMNEHAEPNHRANAMIAAGMYRDNIFTNPDLKSYQYQLKDTWGANFMYGDCAFQFAEGRPLPDCSIYGENPIHFIFNRGTPDSQHLHGLTPPKRFITKHGHSAIMMSSLFVHRPMPDGMITAQSMETRPYRYREYHLSSKNGEANGFMKFLVDTWGEDGKLNLLKSARYPDIIYMGMNPDPAHQFTSILANEVCEAVA